MRIIIKTEKHLFELLINDSHREEENTMEPYLNLFTLNVRSN
jgi:hypothetical protein